jgi:hypothetical protein
MLLLTSTAASKDVGLIATFIGIGVIVNIVVVYIAVQVRGERMQNEERSSQRSSTSV